MKLSKDRYYHVSDVGVCHCWFSVSYQFGLRGFPISANPKHHNVIADYWAIEAEEIAKAYAPRKPYPTFWCEYVFASAWEQHRE